MYKEVGRWEGGGWREDGLSDQSTQAAKPFVQ